MYLVNSDLLE